jgi:CRP-like cAMP-binding protein
MVTTKAPERLLQFLHGFASTRSSSGFIALPMCRRDIADHLGLSVETVSRAFSTLKRTGRISLSGAEKYKINHAALIHVG